MADNFSKCSEEITKELGKKEKRENGIYFTPQSIVKKMLKVIIDKVKKSYLRERKLSILEPSCGSCEFIRTFASEFKKSYIVGVEKNIHIYDSIKHYEKEFPNVSIFNQDFLELDDKNILYDIIIGNPPYFDIKKANVDKKYYKYFTGRPNAYIIFILKCLSQLKYHGVLGFVLPANFMTSLSYNKLRRYINNNFGIEIISCSNDSFLETQQDTIILILEYRHNYGQLNDDYTVRIKDKIIFNVPEKIKKIKKLLESCKTLSDYNMYASIGRVVWNQKKNILTDDESKTLLIYNSYIKDDKIKIVKFKDPKKKNYIDMEGTKEVVIILNRGQGNTKFKLNPVLLKRKKPYLLENHIIKIQYKPKEGEKIDNRKIIPLYKKIIQSMKSEETSKFIELYFENGQINCEELNNILPIYTKYTEGSTYVDMFLYDIDVVL